MTLYVLCIWCYFNFIFTIFEITFMYTWHQRLQWLNMFAMWWFFRRCLDLLPSFWPRFSALLPELLIEDLEVKASRGYLTIKLTFSRKKGHPGSGRQDRHVWRLWKVSWNSSLQCQGWPKHPDKQWRLSMVTAQ